MPNIISHRRILQTIGTLTLLSMSASVAKGLVFSPPRFDQPDPQELKGPKCCFLGAGKIGQALCNKLIRMDPDKNAGIGAYLFHPANIDIFGHLIGNQMVFVAGDMDDHDFWMARDLASSVEPRLLVSFIFGGPIQGGFYSELLPNECQMSLPVFGSRKTALDIVQDIYTSVALPGLVCLDFADIISVLSGKIGYGFAVKSSVGCSLGAFTETVKRNRVKLSAAQGVFCFFSYDPEFEDACTLDDLSSLSETVYGLIPGDANMVWGANVVREVKAGFRGTVVAV